MKKKLFAFILLYLALANVKADDAFLGSRGGNVFPIYSNKMIRMVKEEIKIDMEKDSCIVHCKFWFQNTGKDFELILMGFPDYFEDLSRDSKPLRNFTCKVRGFDMETEKLSQTMQTDADTGTIGYEKWYCWNVTFNPGETVMVENTYVGSWGGRVDVTCSFDYLIGTARTWRNTIGDGKVIFDYSKIASKLFVDTTYEARLPEGLKRVICTDSTVFYFKDYLPEYYETLNLRLRPYWGIPGSGDFGIENNEFPFYDRDIKLPKETIRQMRNEVYARHGYVFKEESIQKYFSSQTWYKPDMAFDNKKFNKFEMSFIKYLEDIEKK